MSPTYLGRGLWESRIHQRLLEHRGQILTHLLDKHLSASQRFEFCCEQGHHFVQSLHSLWYMNGWCRYCTPKGTPRPLNNNLARAQRLAQEREGQCFGTENFDVRHPYPFQCKKGHRFEKSVNQLTQGQWCPECLKLRRAEYQKTRLLSSLPPAARVMKEIRLALPKIETPTPAIVCKTLVCDPAVKFFEDFASMRSVQAREQKDHIIDLIRKVNRRAFEKHVITQPAVTVTVALFQSKLGLSQERASWICGISAISLRELIRKLHLPRIKTQIHDHWFPKGDS